jgi:hypothetical protein
MIRSFPMKLAAFLLAAALPLSAGALVLAQGDAQKPSNAAGGEPVVVELFTSQGCSSCPPADRVARKLAAEPGTVVISRPVTYWDRLGWKDTLASPQNTELQQSYALRGLAGNSGVYTPQAVVDGRTGVVGSDGPALRRLIADARREAKPKITLEPGKDTTRVVRIAGVTTARAQLSVIGFASRATVGVGSGENGGQRIVYSNVFKGEKSLGTWNGGTASFSLPATARTIPGADHYALILRKGKAGPILAARMI